MLRITISQYVCFYPVFLAALLFFFYVNHLLHLERLSLSRHLFFFGCHLSVFRSVIFAQWIRSVTFAVSSYSSACLFLSFLSQSIFSSSCCILWSELCLTFLLFLFLSSFFLPPLRSFIFSSCVLLFFISDVKSVWYQRLPRALSSAMHVT